MPVLGLNVNGVTQLLVFVVLLSIFSRLIHVVASSHSWILFIPRYERTAVSLGFALVSEAAMSILAQLLWGPFSFSLSLRLLGAPSFSQRLCIMRLEWAETHAGGF